jgi:hypothetical protein
VAHADAIRRCPTCRIEARLLDHISKSALVAYYRCDECGAIWVYDKADVDRPPECLTPPRQQGRNLPRALIDTSATNSVALGLTRPVRTE